MVFFQIILTTLVTTPIIARCNGNIEKKSISALVLLILSSILYQNFHRLPLQVQMLCFESAIMIIGNICRQLKFFTKSYIPNFKTKILVIVLTGIFNVLLVIANPDMTRMALGQIGSFDNIIDIATNLLLLASGIIAFYELCVLLKRFKYPRIILC